MSITKAPKEKDSRAIFNYNQPQKISKIIEKYQDGMLAVEWVVSEACLSENTTLQDISLGLLGHGGKRIRPLLTLVVAKAFGLNSYTSELINVAAGIELIHMASLLHDDIIDNSEKRRNSKSALKQHGLPAALLAGDFLFVKAFGLCAKLDSAIINETEQSCVALTVGELMDGGRPADNFVKHALDVAVYKTGSLFGLASFCGSYIATSDISIARKMREFGINVGVAFQIADDILDISSPSPLFGKEQGADLRTKKLSVVNALWLESGSDIAKELFSPDISPPVADELIEKSIADIESRGILFQAKAKAQQCSKKALKVLNELETHSNNHSNNRYFRDLTDIIAILTERIS